MSEYINKLIENSSRIELLALESKASVFFFDILNENTKKSEAYKLLKECYNEDFLNIKPQEFICLCLNKGLVMLLNEALIITDEGRKLKNYLGSDPERANKLYSKGF